MSIRSAIELHIIAKANQIRWRAPNCFDEASIDGFIASWFDLIHFYENNEDSDIGIEVMREYVYWSDAFQAIKHDPATTSDCRNIADDALTELRSQFHEIVKIIEQRLYPIGQRK